MADWLREGDKNTKFFHSKASFRKREKKNKIRGIQDAHGKWIEEIEEVTKQFYEYFAYLFSTSNPSRD